MRNESDAVLPAIDEALRIGREGRLPVEIWHIKVAGKQNWGRMPEVVAKINAARAAGMDITADTYALYETACEQCREASCDRASKAHDGHKRNGGCRAADAPGLFGKPAEEQRAGQLSGVAGTDEDPALRGSDVP